MFRGGVESWNLRDRHMAETLDELVAHLEATSGPTKVVVWAHNSHLGDERATELAQAGQLNLGQLMREKHGDETLLVGLTTYRPGTERVSHYFHARLADQFDVVIHIDAAHALEPLERSSEWEPESCPKPIHGGSDDDG